MNEMRNIELFNRYSGMSGEERGRESDGKKEKNGRQRNDDRKKTVIEIEIELEIPLNHENTEQRNIRQLRKL